MKMLGIVAIGMQSNIHFHTYSMIVYRLLQTQCIMHTFLCKNQK